MRRAPRRTIVVAMTETTHDDPVPPLPPPGSVPPQREAPRLVRDPDDAVVAGVCAAFGRYTDTDPVLWRVTVAVLTLFGGAGLVLYALGWLLVPRRGEHRSFAERTLRRPDHGISPAGVLLVVVGAVVLLAVLDDGPGFGALLVIAGIAYLVVRERRDPRTPGGHDTGLPPYDAAVPRYDTAVPNYDTAVPSYDAPTPSYDTASFAAAPYATAPWDATPARRTRRPRSPLGALTLSVALLLTGVLSALRLSGVDALTPERILAVALLVVGAGLLVGVRVGRARWLIPVGLVLALLTAGTAAARSAGLEDGFGERTWTPTAGGEYSLGAGEAVLDLSDLPPGADAEIDAEIGFGSLTVLVPSDVRAQVVAEAGLGEVSRVELGGRRTVLSTDDTDLRETFTVPGTGDGTVQLDLEVGVGEIEVRRVAA
jgi:phage shock protein PspC (stress-responsive transcriptional regulator)